MTVASPIIVALDYSQPDQALAMADRLDPAKVRVKVGKELFTRGGPDVVRALHDKGFQVFLDLKFHDIPNTVAGAVKAAADLGVWMVNVHASGGSRMMLAAREALVGLEGARPREHTSWAWLCFLLAAGLGLGGWLRSGARGRG